MCGANEMLESLASHLAQEPVIKQKKRSIHSSVSGSFVAKELARNSSIGELTQSRIWWPLTLH
jgi:hypothetical protein